MPKLCEKCGNYDPAQQLTTDSRCPCCGLVYAKLPQPSVSEVSTSPALPTGAPELLLETTKPVSGWLPLKRAEVWLSVAGSVRAVCDRSLRRGRLRPAARPCESGLSRGGPPLLRTAGQYASVLYGGTLGQLVFPIVAAVRFRRQRQAVGVALSGVWLFENFLNIARYMEDARAQLLPLVSGGEHDWYHIFTRWGLLEPRHRYRVRHLHARLARHDRLHGLAVATIFLQANRGEQSRVVTRPRIRVDGLYGRDEFAALLGR